MKGEWESEAAKYRNAQENQSTEEISTCYRSATRHAKAYHIQREVKLHHMIHNPQIQASRSKIGAH